MLPESSPPPPPPLIPPPLPRPSPPVWPALVVPVVAILAAVVFAGLVQGAMLFSDPGFRKTLLPSVRAVADPTAPEVEPDRKARHGEKRYPEVRAAPAVRERPDFRAFSERLLTGMLDKPYGVAVLLLPGQAMLAVVALGAAALSPQRKRERLGFVRSALPWWTLPVLIITTIFLGMVGGLTVDRLFPGPHHAMEAFAAMARSGSFEVALLNTALISLVPGLVEETLFRGYVQRRLLERWTPLAAVGVSSALFSASHLDFQHIIAIVPVGVWLGVIAWRSGAVWPGMVCHASMNALSFAMLRLGAGQEDPTVHTVHTIPPGMWVVLAFGAAVMGLAILLMRRYPPGRLVTLPVPA